MNNTSNFTEKAMALKPLYQELINSVEEFKNSQDEESKNKILEAFCIQWGNNYPEEDNSGLIFYGRAANGWGEYNTDVDRLFDLSNDKRIFACERQMQWAYDLEGNTQGYNTNQSAFWRVIKSVSSNLNKDLHQVCWSNVCKIAPKDDKPSDSLYYAELDACQAIMKEELRIFSPRHVVMLTGINWAKDFLRYLNSNKPTHSIAQYPWGYEMEYCVKVYLINGIYFYVSEHPQGKDETTHVNALGQAIKEHAIKEKLNKWAKQYVPQFCELSETYKNNFYTQSSLKEIDDSPRLMVIAINPKGAPNNGAHKREGKRSEMSPTEDYLSGNVDWNNRFDENGVITSKWSKYLSNTRYFLGFPPKKDDYFDDDKKVVWTNMTPFVSNNGFSDLRKLSPDLVKVGIESTIELIKILNPQKIVLLGYGAFDNLERECKEDAKFPIEHMKVLDNADWRLEVGYINKIPAVCVNHPSGRGKNRWPISNAFVPVFIYLHSIAIQKCSTLNAVVDYMRKELKAWQKQISSDEEI
jgi:hypothetical protein